MFDRQNSSLVPESLGLGFPITRARDIPKAAILRLATVRTVPLLEHDIYSASHLDTSKIASLYLSVSAVSHASHGRPSLLTPEMM
jgi:hypothetical protein